jgi:hypothetical protein
MFVHWSERGVVALLMVLTLASTGCGKVREIRACRAISQRVNGAMDEIETLSKKNPPDTLSIAKRYGTLAKAVEPMSTGPTTLAQAVAEYVQVLRGTEVALRNIADPVRNSYAKAADHRELERLVKRERAAVVRIEVECHR